MSVTLVLKHPNYQSNLRISSAPVRNDCSYQSLTSVFVGRRFLNWLREWRGPLKKKSPLLADSARCSRSASSSGPHPTITSSPSFFSSDFFFFSPLYAHNIYNISRSLQSIFGIRARNFFAEPNADGRKAMRGQLGVYARDSRCWDCVNAVGWPEHS